MNKKRSVLCLLFLVLMLVIRHAVAFDIPPKPNPPRLVNDYADVLSADEERSLENKLVAYSDSTSTQIAVVIISTLDGADIVQTAYRIGDAWGVGGKNQDNGVVILAAIQDRQVTIQTGKGMEGPIPDVTADRIIENIIVPNFRSNNYYKGFDEATDAIMKLASGEFVDELGDTGRQGPAGFVIIIIIIIILIILSRINRGGRGRYLNRRGTFFGPIFWGGGGFGGGGFGGGGGGGFGGFGGGSFGGGGASGRW